jgi:hypothetical protein
MFEQEGETSLLVQPSSGNAGYQTYTAPHTSRPTGGISPRHDLWWHNDCE